MNISCPDLDCPLHCTYTLVFADNLTAEQERRAGERRRSLALSIGVCSRYGGPKVLKPYEIKDRERKAGLWNQ